MRVEDCDLEGSKLLDCIHVEPLRAIDLSTVVHSYSGVTIILELQVHVSSHVENNAKHLQADFEIHVLPFLFALTQYFLLDE